MPNRTATPLLNLHCQLGENPLWNTEDGCLYWTDIDAGLVHRFHLQTQEHRTLYQGPKVGGFTFQQNGDLLLFRIDDLALLQPNGQIIVLRTLRDEGMERFNDVIADPRGRVFAGTIGATEQSGGVYRVDPDGTITLLFRGTGCSNGMGFSPDLVFFYWTCSTSGCIYRFPYDRLTGQLGPRALLHRAEPAQGIPDGLAVDAQGHLWSARWDGRAIIHHTPDGQIVEAIHVPVPKVTSLCFGGPDLSQLFVTTAGGRPDADTADGALFQLPAPVRGLPEFKSCIGLAH